VASDTPYLCHGILPLTAIQYTVIFTFYLTKQNKDVGAKRFLCTKYDLQSVNDDDGWPVKIGLHSSILE